MIALPLEEATRLLAQAGIRVVAVTHTAPPQGRRASPPRGPGGAAPRPAARVVRERYTPEGAYLTTAEPIPGPVVGEEPVSGHLETLSEEELLARLDPSRLPRHVAVIMDGNGRWAEMQGKPRLEGHRASRESVRETVRASSQLGLQFLTLYTFSTENWRRPQSEVTALMALIEETLKAEIAELHQNRVKVVHLGVRDGLPASLLRALDDAAEVTKENTGLNLYLAINYGGRQEMAAAAAALAEEVLAGRLSPDRINEERLAAHLYRPELPDPDLLVRTGGDLRISNYLLWQMAYTEIYVTPVLWPDFRKVHLLAALLEYQGRQRRFGGLL